MTENVKNDLYDVMDLLNRIHALSFLQDKERLNELRSQMLRVMQPSSNVKADEESMYTMYHMQQLVSEMNGMRRKAALIDFAKAMDIRLNEKDTLEVMRGAVVLELVRRSSQKEAALGQEAGKKKKGTTNKKDFMDRWIDFYKKNREQR